MSEREEIMADLEAENQWWMEHDRQAEPCTHPAELLRPTAKDDPRPYCTRCLITIFNERK